MSPGEDRSMGPFRRSALRRSALRRSARRRSARRTCLCAAVGLVGVAAGCTVESSPDAQLALDPEAPAVLAVADAALEAISGEDMVAFTDLMVEGAISVPTSPNGFGIRSREDWLTSPGPGDIVERGFDPDVRVSGTIAMVWYPYDLYIDGEWSHCGVDVFTMAHTPDAGWRIVSIGWSVEQPPACREHPDGPP